MISTCGEDGCGDFTCAYERKKQKAPAKKKSASKNKSKKKSKKKPSRKSNKRSDTEVPDWAKPAKKQDL